MTMQKMNKDVEASDPQTEAKKGPAKQFRVDDVSASVFARERNGRNFYSVSFSRSYKDRDGSYKYTTSFDADDLGRVVTVAQQASEYIHGIVEQVAQ